MSSNDLIEASPVGSAPDMRNDALYDLIAPQLGTWERTVRVAEPSLPDADVLDRALREALAHLRQDVAQQTLRYLRWRAEQARAAAQATVANSAAARKSRAAAREAATAPDDSAARPLQTDAEQGLALVDEQRCFFRDGAGCVWNVYEVAAGAVPWAKGRRCLLFDSESAIRRVWRYPPDWRTLSEAELETLSWCV